MESRPLVSVIVIAYNSSRYILETLDSVLAQAYGPIELIVADDSSTDDTAAIAGSWLARHGDRFTSARLVRGETNVGIAANCNRALRHARGAWLKLVAADDVLLPECIRDHVENALLHPDVSVFFSRMEVIDENSLVKGEYLYPEAFFTYPVERQLKCLLHRNCLPAPSAFIRMDDLRAAGCFDEEYPMLEDLPLWVRMLGQNLRLGGLDKCTVRYRRHPSLAWPILGKRNERYRQTLRAFDRTVRIPLARRLSPLLHLTVRVDILVDAVVQRPLAARALYPFLWLWAKLSPFRIRPSLASKKWSHG